MHTGLLPRIRLCRMQEYKVRFAHRFATAYIRLYRMQEYKVRFALSRFATAPLSLLLYTGAQSSFCKTFATTHPFSLLYAGGKGSFCTQVCYRTSVFAALCRSTKFILHACLLRTSVFTACRSTQTSEVTSIVVSHGMLGRTSVQNVQREETSPVTAPAGLWTATCTPERSWHL